MVILGDITFCLRKKPQKLQSIVVMIAILTSSFLFLHPSQLLAQQQQLSSTASAASSSTSVPALLSLVNCSVARPLADPVEMNTVVFKDIAKTVHVEKEVFTCKTKSGASVIALVSLYTELFENMKTLKSLNKTVEAVTCVKGFNGTVSWCQSKVIPILNQLIWSSCDPRSLRVQPILSPIEMQTVVSASGVAKTVEAEKEVFLCDFKQNVPTKLLDVTLFTEIFENMLSGKVLKKSVESVTCLKDISTASVLKCGYLRHL